MKNTSGIMLMFIVCAISIMGGCACPPFEKYTEQTVEAVDLSRYMGKWYAIASLPAWFQKKLPLRNSGILTSGRPCESGQFMPKRRFQRPFESQHRQGLRRSGHGQFPAKSPVFLAFQGGLLDCRAG